MTIKSIFKISPLLFLYSLLAVLTGYFLDFIIVFFLIVVHEFGHYLCAKILGIQTLGIVLYPLGGISKMDMDISVNPMKEILILIMGPIFQFLAYFFLSKVDSHSELIQYYHYGILFFNLLPIYPLDGGRFFHILLSFIVPYRLALYSSIMIGYLTAIILLFGSQTISLNMILFYVLFIFLIRREELKIPFLMHKFLLERLLKKIPFSKIKYINHEKNMYRYRNNYIRVGNTWQEEKQYLKKKYNN